MKDPKNYFQNLFSDARLSGKHLAALTTDHIGKLRNQNTRSGGQWSARLDATVEAMERFDAALSDDMVKANLRKARKLAKNRLRRALPDQVRAIVNWVEAHYGSRSPQVAAIVGKGGVNQLRAMPDDLVAAYLQGVIDKLMPLVPTIGQVRVDEAEAIHEEWDAVYAASEQATAARQLAEERLRAAKAALCDELFRTLLEVALAHRHRPEVLGDFFTPSLAGGPPLRARRR